MKQLLFPLSLLTIILCSSFSVPAQNAARATELSTGLQGGQYELSDYNTACYFAMAGNNKLALSYLRKSLNDGFSNLKTITTDTDLEPLHNEPEWTALIKLAEQNAANKSSGDGLFFNQPSFWETKSFHTPYKENISENEKLAGLSKFWSEAKYNFVNFDLVPSVDIDSLYMAYIPKVKSTKSTLEYYRVLTELCAQLKDGHTNVNAPAELQNDVYARPLMRTRLVENKVLVVQADPSLRAKGIKPGVEILTIDGVPVKEYAAKFVTPYQSASTPQDLQNRSYEYALLSGSVKKPVQLKLQDDKGAVSTQEVNRVTGQERSAKMSYPPLEYKVLPGNISYLVINGFDTDTGSKYFIQHYPEIEKGNGLIIDLRNNGGGNTDWTILRYLVDSVMTVHQMYSREYVPTKRAWQSAQSVWSSSNGIGPVPGHHYDKPVILLVSARTFSAAEDFAAAFKSIHKGKILGQPTGGSTGQPLFFTLPGNITARVCTKRDRFADGTDFVGKGILPDITVYPTVSDMRKGVDTELEAALKEIKKQ